MWRTLLALLLISAAPLAAQDRDEPDRPGLPEAADTNSALDYYNWGISKLQSDADAAADAFYWASRLVPGWAAPLYARRIALLLDNPRRLVGYVERKKRVMRSGEIRHIDSLELRARQLDPFIHRTLEWALVRAYLMESTMQSLRREYRNANVRVEELRSEVEHYIDRMLLTGGGAQWRAWRAYSNGQLADALGYFAKALGRSDNKASLHLLRGQIFYLLQQLDSAQVALSHALELTREEDDDDLVFIYESKAMLEYSIAMAFEAAGKADEARDAYSRALMEDMSFYPAHVQMGSMALAAGDTLTGLTEYGLAVEVEPNLPWLRMMLGELQLKTGQHAEAAASFERAIELEPYFAEPYLMLASAHEELGNPQGATASYQDFLARAMLNHEKREWVEGRLGTLARRP